jgi:hypothetical protein
VIALLGGAALAWTPSVVELASQPAISEVAAKSSKRAVVAGPDETQVYDSTGKLRHTWAIGARSVDVDALGGDVLGCGDHGLWWARQDGSDVAEPVILDPAPCDAVTSLGDRVVLARDGGLLTGAVLYGELVDVAHTGVRFAGEPVLVEATGHVYAAEIGGTTLYDLTDTTLTTRPLGGALGGLGVADGEAAWTLSDRAVLVTSAGESALDASPGAFLVADLDTDGTDDLLVVHDGWMAAHVSAVAAVQRLEVAPEHLAPWGPTSAGCDWTAFVDEGRASTLTVSDCGRDTDDDGDGWTESQGDCSDRDADRSPAVVETCDGVDQDCDGTIDDLDRFAILDVVMEDREAIEGWGTTFVASYDGCVADAEWSSEPPADWWGDEEDATIIPERPGTHVVTLTARDTLGRTATHTFSFEARDLVPSGWISMPTPIPVGMLAEGRIWTDDLEPGLYAEITEAPEGLEVDGIEIDWAVEGEWDLRWRPSEPGAYTIRARLADDEGNTEDLETTVDVYERGCGCGDGEGGSLLDPYQRGGGCDGSRTGLALWPAAVALLRRRIRRPAEAGEPRSR